MKVNDKSWHYEFYRAGVIGFFEHLDRNESVHQSRNKTDLCTYMRKMCLGLFFVLGEILIITLLTLVMLGPVLSLGAFLVTDNGWINVIPDVLNAAGSVIWGILAIGFIGYLKFETKVGKAIKIPTSIKNSVKESGTIDFFKNVYKSFKEKTCILIEVVDNKQ